MPKAIIMSYTCGQNRPSTPATKLLEIPDDPRAREIVLRKAWAELGGEPDDFRLLTKEQNRNSSDIAVTDADWDLFLFAWFVTN